jgi:hypothetical protein
MYALEAERPLPNVSTVNLRFSLLEGQPEGITKSL